MKGVYSLENHRLNYEQLEARIESFLMEHISGSLATCINDIPRSSPVQYFLGKDLTIYIPSAGGQKFKAIEGNKNVCLLVNTEYLDFRRIKGVQVFGKASTSVRNKELIEEANPYLPQAYLLEEGKWQAIKIIPYEIIYLDSIERGERVKQVLRIQDKLVEVRDEELSGLLIN